MPKTPICTVCLRPHEPTCPVTGGRAATTTIYDPERVAYRIAREDLDAYLSALESTCTCGHDAWHHPEPGTSCVLVGCECRRFDPQARVIRVKDLGAALEARELGGRTFEPRLGGRPPSLLAASATATRNRARNAAHLARHALGEVEDLHP